MINNDNYIQTLSKMLNILANIKKDRFESRDEWIKLSMILHYEFYGNNIGLDIQKSYSWYSDECLIKWKGFNINNKKQLTKSKLHEWELEDNNTKSVDAGDYVKFIGKVVDYAKLKYFIKKTFIQFIYIFDGGNLFWLLNTLC